MTPFAKDKAAQQKVTDSAAVLSGQELRGCPNENADQDILTIRSWAREAKEVIAFWQGYLSSDRDEPMDLIEANGLKMSMQSLRRILSRYLFGDNAQLRSVDPDAWSGIQRHWVLIHMNIEGLWEEILDYRDWIAEIERRSSQIADPMAMRKMVRQKRKDTQDIVTLYTKLVDNMAPVIKEIVELT